MAALSTVRLTGRRSESDVLDALVEAVRAGESQVLVVHGEPGVGKSALLEYLADHASGCRVVRAAGVQSEMELAFAGLHQLLMPMLDHLERLPLPQGDALRTAFGVSAGPTPDRFFIALAVLSLLSEVAEEKPLICLVDDEQWLDRASAHVLAFVARRLEADSVALVFAARVPSDDFAGLPELVVEGLGEEDARALLDSALTGPLDERVRDQIVSETRGNPLALLELPRGVTPAELAGGFGLPGAVPLSGRIEESFRRRVEALPTETRRLLQLAAADPVGDPVLVWRAVERLGIPADAATPAVEAELLDFGTRVRFRHPLVRSAAYRSASSPERQVVHRALAEVTDPEVDPDRRAWHLAQGTLGPDEGVAEELERSAGRAQARGGLAAAAAFLERAAMLTPDPARRAQRLLAAARAKRDAGALDAALGLLVSVEAGPLDALRSAQVEHLRGQIAFDQRRISDAARLLLSAARRLEALDANSARETHLEALGAALWASDLDSTRGVLEAAEAARAAPAGPDPPRVVDVLLDAFALRLTEGYAAAAPTLTRALELFRALEVGTDEVSRWLLLTGGRGGAIVALERWDDESWHELAARQVQLARDTGALVHLQLALSLLARSHILAGELTAAAHLFEEGRLIAEATGNPPVAYIEMMLAAWRGQEAPASELIEATLHDPAAVGAGRIAATYASAVLDNGLGRHDAARDASWRVFERDQVGLGPLVVPELVEAASKTGDAALLRTALEWLSERTRVTHSEWALGIETRVRALLGDGETAESHYRESIERLGRTRIRVELARGHLLYGEWLRRENRRVDAREQLRTAHELFDAMGTDAFAERARRELLATGETVRKRTVETRGDLTAQEAQIARLARDGLSNPEIATRLFISPRTVQYHLRKVFIKLGIRSRSQLDRVLPSDATTVPRSSRGGPGRRAARPTTGHSHCALADAIAAPAKDTPRMRSETHKGSIGIIGAGHLGQAFARTAQRAGRKVVIANSRGPQSLEPVAAALGTGVSAGTIGEAAASAMVVIAVPWTSVPAAVAGLSWGGEIVIDTTNAILFPDLQPAPLDGRTSSEIVADLVVGARVVKAGNTLSAELLGADPHDAGGRRVLFLSGDDGDAKAEVAALFEAAGFSPIDLGDLATGGRMQQAPGGPLPGHNLVQLP